MLAIDPTFPGVTVIRLLFMVALASIVFNIKSYSIYNAERT